MKKKTIAKINKRIQDQIRLIKEAGTEVCEKANKKANKKYWVCDELEMDEYGVCIEVAEEEKDRNGRSIYHDYQINFEWEEFWSPKKHFVEKFKSLISGKK